MTNSDKLVERVALAIWKSMDVTDGLTEWVAKKYARAAIEAYEQAALSGSPEG